MPTPNPTNPNPAPNPVPNEQQAPNPNPIPAAPTRSTSSTPSTPPTPPTRAAYVKYFTNPSLPSHPAPPRPQTQDQLKAWAETTPRSDGFFQIDPTLPFSTSLNADLTEIQTHSRRIGPAESFSQAVAVAAESTSDPASESLIPGTQLMLNRATTIQRMIAEEYALLPASNPISDRPLAAILSANPGPLGSGNWWNWPVSAFGTLPSAPRDPSLVPVTVLVVNGSKLETVGAWVDPALVPAN